MDGIAFDIRNMAELERPVGFYGTAQQVEVAGDLIFSIIVGVVVTRNAAGSED